MQLKKNWTEILKKEVQLPFIGGIRYYYFLIVFLIAFYIITNNVLIGIVAGLSILLFFLFEIFEGVGEHGIKNEIKELFIALILAAFLWYGLGFLLKTPTPINAIVSCSMLPAYDRGDLIILSGEKINTHYINYDKEIFKEINSEIFAFYENKKLNLSEGLFSYCMENQENELCLKFKEKPEKFSEKYGPITINYGLCSKMDKKTKKIFFQTCIKEVYVNNQKITIDKNEDLIVYTPAKEEIYSLVGGDIIHRAVFAINATDGLYYFTKGDNNQVFDFQYSSKKLGLKNQPVKLNQIKGKSILKIPYLGYFKLVITPQVLLLSEKETGCWGYFID